MNGKEQAQQIREREIGSQNKQALIVEGSDDKTALTILLKNYYPTWEQRWVIAIAGNKQRVLKVLGVEPTWIGLVDRDTWDQATIDQQAQALPNLVVLNRWCMENYLINPAELWLALPSLQQTKVEGGEANFTHSILGTLPEYVRHGVLWQVITPLRSGLHARGFMKALATESSVATAQDDGEIRRVLEDWDQLLEPRHIFAEFQQHLREVQQLAQAEQLARWVHGKTFWKQVVHPYMNNVFGQMPEMRHKEKLFQKLLLPSDLESLRQRLQLGADS